MPLSSGQLSFSEIQGEFGGSNPISLSEYYKTGAYVPNISLTSTIPTSSTISVGNFRSTSVSPAFTTFAAQPDPGTHGLMQSVAVSPSGVWMATGFTQPFFTDPTPYGASYSRSTDGINWSSPTIIPGVANNLFSTLSKVICRNDGLFVAVGTMKNSYGAISQSGGVSWNAPQEYPNQLFGVALNNNTGLFVAGYLNGFMYSGDAYNWGYLTSPGAPASYVIANIVCRESDNRWVGVGNMSSRPARTYSTDGYNWATITTAIDLGGYSSFESVTVSPKTGRFVCCGALGGQTPIVGASDDGINWAYSYGMWGGYGRPNYVTCNRAGVYIMVGSGYDIGGLPWWSTSTDGLNWTSPTPVSNDGYFSDLRGVIVDNYVNSPTYGRFAAVGAAFRQSSSGYRHLFAYQS